MSMRKVLVIALGVAALFACGRIQLGDSGKAREVDAALRRTVQAPSRPAFITNDREGAQLWKLTQAFYRKRSFQPAWMRANAEPRSNMEAFVAALGRAGEHGLDPELYAFSGLQAKFQEASKGFLSKKGFDPAEAGALDVWLTYLYMKFASDLANGMSDLAHADRAWQITPEKIDPLAHLEQALERKRIAESLSELAPGTSHYQLLLQALADHRAQAARGGWPTLPPGLRLKPDARQAQVRALAQRLAASGDYRGPIPSQGQPAVYDGPLQEAVARFQRRHGLADDGVVTPAVVAQMNVPIERRIEALELNLERWRWLPRNPGPLYMLVNIPEMSLDVWENDRIALSMRVVVGKRETPTPIFNDAMTHVVFSPYWNVPPGIAQEETLPSLMNDPEFLERNNMEVVDASGRPIDPESIDGLDAASVRFRQRPGSDNALGLVKFMFPNKFDVYLHDTPADSLFGRAARLFSHGCVRVEKPEELAAYVLRDRPEWTRERIREAMHAGEERTVRLREPIPVFIGYWTARVTADGIVQFREDVYGIDGRQRALLAERMRRLRSSSAAAVAAAAKPEAGKKAEKRAGKR